MSGQSESQWIADEVAAALSPLPPLERRVLILYFGLEQTEPLTIDEIAMAMGMPVAAAGELKARALRMLRAGGGPGGAAMAMPRRLDEAS
jgi:DNA-directed RNA polymerase specialized sigma24 family protein